jgi:hypothetical protein
MGIAFALEKNKQQLVGAVGRNVFREPKSHAHPEFACLAHVRHQQLEMIEPLRLGPMMLKKGNDEPRLDVHARAEFDRHAARIDDMQRAALVRNLDPFGRHAGGSEEPLCLFQIFLGEDAHADALGFRLAARAFEHETVVTCLGHAAQKERVGILVADNEAEEVDIKPPACRKVLHAEHAVTRARDIERWIVDGRRDAHGRLRNSCDVTR